MLFEQVKLSDASLVLPTPQHILMSIVQFIKRQNKLIHHKHLQSDYRGESNSKQACGVNTSRYGESKNTV